MLIRDIANNRENRLLEDLKSGDLYRPKLNVFVRTKILKPKKSGLFAKVESFANTALDSYAETLELLNQNLESIRSFDGSGLSTKQLSRSDLIAHIYSFLNPKRSISEPSL